MVSHKESYDKQKNAMSVRSKLSEVCYMVKYLKEIMSWLPLGVSVLLIVLPCWHEVYEVEEYVSC